MKLIFSAIMLVVIALVYLYLADSLSEKPTVTHELNLDLGKSRAAVKKLESISHYNSIIDRPLFVEERRFEEEKKPVTIVKPVAVIEKLNVKALGIALSGEGLIAVLTDKKNGKTLRMRIGEKIYGWTLKGVSESSFTFSKGGKEKVVNFKE
jgi:hypothetical protein